MKLRVDEEEQMMNSETLKREAAYTAVEQEVRSGMKLGLGSGSTVAHALSALAEMLRVGRIENIVGVPTSEQTAEQAHDHGIPLAALHELDTLDVTIDGADEIDPNLNLIKGLGGALLREKMVVQATQRLVIVADDSKRVKQLGVKAPLPVEVVSFGWRAHLPFLKSLGCRPERRETNSEPYVTDNGNYIIDCHFPAETGIEDPAVLDWQLLGRAGIVEHGLFLELAEIAYVAGTHGVTTLKKAP